MMIKTITLVALLFAMSFPMFSVAQCNPAIPSGAAVLSKDSTTTSNKSVWVCGGVTYVTNANSATIYLEIGAYYYGKNGIGNTVYVPKGATVKFDQAAVNSKIYFVDSADVLGKGTSATLTQCTNIAYNYVSAPTNGCVTTTEIASVRNNEQNLSVYPNPAHGSFKVSFDQPLSGAAVKIFNMLGAEVYSDVMNGRQKIIASNLVPGIYFIRISEGSKEWMQKLVLQ